MKTVEERLSAIEGQWTNSRNPFKKGVAIWGHAILGYLTVIVPIAIATIVLVSLVSL